MVWFTSRFKNSKEFEKIRGVKIVRRGSSATVYLFAFLYYINNRKSIDLVVDQIHGIPFFTPLYVRKPKIAFIHEVAGEIWDYMSPFPLNKIGKFFENYYFKLYKNIPFWVPGESTINDLVAKGIRRSQCTRIYCAISNKTISKLKNKSSVPTFLFVSRIVKMKGIEDVLTAFYEINKVLPASQLLIVGSGEKSYINFILRICKKLNIDKKIKYYGHVSNTKKLEIMSKSHILLHASIKEGWGLVVVEAASQGTPSVVYDAAGLRESVRNNKTGIVIGSNSPKELAKEAISLYENKKKYKLFQEEGLRWAKSLSWGESKKKSMELINSTYQNAK